MSEEYAPERQPAASPDFTARPYTNSDLAPFLPCDNLPRIIVDAIAFRESAERRGRAAQHDVTTLMEKMRLMDESAVVS